ncbi:pimeloyl-ACP methyl ester carboxylesterase [Crossiella equi]|uniref:Pimeloyl-ACP methyl ester carboxylesterase n=1 Tax=Crossiella equi TaxID=130796 RepID=A0ABS5A3S8_9PSEU|nr:alpha/beta hydrolase [Crossiella equi]MBP2471225.1 pimeloyl-ACP methyl ester carboxylesterase [Crossiella equi]
MSEALLLEDGTVLNVVRRGDPGAPVTVVFTHGYALDHREWHRQLEVLESAVARPVQLLAYDHRGHGESSPATAETATIDQLADDLAVVIERAVPEGRVVVVGHSMGGMAALALAVRRPRLFAQRVGGLVLLSTAAGGFAEANLGLAQPVGRLVLELEQVFGRIVRKVREKIEPAKTAGLKWFLFGAKPRQEDVDLTADMVWSNWPETVALFTPALDRHDREAAMSVVEHAALDGTEVVIMTGDQDRLCPTSHVAEIAKVVGRGEQVLVPGAGHMLPLERPDEVTGRIASVVDSLT